jgi:hypothetical protein
MSNMILGTYTFLHNPGQMSPIKSERSTAKVDTYSSVGFFSWGVSIVGKEIMLEWNILEIEQVDSLNALYIADAPVVWDPQDGYGKTYNVEIRSLDWDYQILLGSGSGIYRKNVKMILLILSEV